MHHHRVTTTSIAFLTAALFALGAPAADWPQWCGTDGKNMVSSEKGLPDSFVPGDKRSLEGTIDLTTARNVKWGVKICEAFYSTPTVAAGKVFIGGMEPENGIFACLSADSGKLLWKWKAPARAIPRYIDGFLIGSSSEPAKLGVCSSAAVEADRVYFVSNRFDVVCLDIHGAGGAEAGNARVVWTCDTSEKLGVFPCDAANGSPLVDGDLLYVPTSNGVDRNSFAAPQREIERKFPAPDAPNLIVLDKRDGRLVASDDLRIADRILHGQWSSPSLGKVNGRKLIFFAAGDGACYAFEAIASAGAEPVKLKTVWSCDCIPPEYVPPADIDPVVHYSLGDKRVRGTLNKHDGTFVGMSEIIATPVFVKNRIYVPIGRDPAHGRGRGALHCIDATGTGDITKSGKIWTYQGLDRTLSTVSVDEGLVYVSDVGGRLHCVDADTGKCYWIHDTQCETWGSTLVADGKVYMPTSKGLWVLATGKELKVLDRINLGAKVYASPVVADGTLYFATNAGWLWAVRRQ